MANMKRMESIDPETRGTGSPMNDACRELIDLAVEFGAELCSRLIEDEVTACVGEKGRHNGRRAAYRHGKERTSIVLAETNVVIERSRVRSKDGNCEIPLESLGAFQREDRLSRSKLGEIFASVSKQKYDAALTPGGSQAGREHTEGKPAQFYAEMKDVLSAYFARRMETVFRAVTIDCTTFGASTITAAAGMGEDGKKRVIGLIEGRPDDPEIAGALIADLAARGLNKDVARFYAPDACTALRREIRRVFGEETVIEIRAVLPEGARAYVTACKLSRKDQVYEAVRAFTANLATEAPGGGARNGIDAHTIGQRIGVSRNNVSKELNQLYKERKVVKIAGKPVLYLDRALTEGQGDQDVAGIGEPAVARHMRTAHTGNPHIDSLHANFFRSGNSLDRLVGADASLKKQIEYAKAAVLYPPDGLHLIITGPTGVGKTTFAENLHKFAVEVGKLSADAPFVVFNCADYSDNQQLLVSQLFGHVRGAFTGADQEKRGLVDKADKGILFLDEVHRLSNEGQEMLFMLLDNGVFRRLGESENTRAARVLLLAATTKDPNSSMLKTFLRRIPVMVKLPTLEERTPAERMQFICNFFNDQSVRIGMPVKVAKEVLKGFMIYDCPGNIGQLKSDIQLICARAFLDFVSNSREQLEVKISYLSDEIRNGLFRVSEKKSGLTRYFNLYTDRDLLFGGIERQGNLSLQGGFRMDGVRYARVREQGLEARDCNPKEDCDAEKKNDIRFLENCDIRDFRVYLVHFIEEILPVLNARKICGILNAVLDDIAASLEKTVDNSLNTKFILHCSCMISRVIGKEGYPYAGLRSMKRKEENF
ncbi:MAG: sigma 54-interacting transcriptional regulator, partial [Clostridiales Family XIII bacterium]|nr:sigma 54-interacting transcriptional regulator [Clostridiales Family XIII bacterium]